MNQNRRQPRPDPHAMYVRVVMGGWQSGADGVEAQPYLKIACACGVVVGGRRYEDRTMVTLTDLLELVRIHRSQMGGP